MRKVIAKNTWYYQGNNAQVEITRDYTLSVLQEKLSEREYKRISGLLPKYIVCGPESMACALDIQKWPLNIFTPGEQPGDSIFNIMNNPLHEKFFRAIKPVPTKGWGYNEIPQYYPGTMKLIYGRDEKDTLVYNKWHVRFIYGGKIACEYAWKIDYEEIVECLDQNILLLVAIPGHFILLNGYDYTDPKNRKLISKDPMYGNNKEYPERAFGWHVKFFPYPG